MIPESLMEKIEKNNIPLFVHFELTHRCNLRCRQCYLSTRAPEENTEELSTEKIKGVLNQLASAGSFYLSLTGGEIFLRGDIFEIISYACKKNFALSLLTNGTLITPQIADRLAEFPILRVQISVLGATPETHDSITRVQGSFELTISRIRLLKQRGINVTTATVLMKQNFSEYREIKKLTKDLEIDAPSFVSLVIPKNIGDKTPAFFRLDDSQMYIFYKDAFNESLEAEQSIRKREFSVICRAGKTGVFISPKGEISGCSGLPKVPGNIKENSFLELWNCSDPFWQKLRGVEAKDLKKCSSCPLSREFCFRCAQVAYMEEGDAFSFSNEACRIAKVIKEVLDERKEEKVRET